MRGFGSSYDGDEPFDWGFGDPTPDEIGAGDRGFGSPADGSFPAYIVHRQIPDDGGTILSIPGQWPIRGPYRVRLQRGPTVYPDPATTLGCYSAIPTPRGGGKGSLCEATRDLAALVFSVPPLPPGTYDVVVAWGVAWGESLTLPGAFTVVYRGRCPGEYRLRSAFPGRARTGPRSDMQSPLLTADRESVIRDAFPMNIRETLTGAIAQEFQTVHGRPQTRTVLDLGPDDDSVQVETLLAFPESGAFYCGGRRYTYTETADDPPTLGGLIPNQNDGTTIPRGSPIVLDVSVIP